MARFVAFILFPLLLTAGHPAHAHAVLVETVPADGAVLADPPGEVILRFNEPVALVTVRVLDIDARPIADGARARVENEAVVVPLPPDLPNATYVVSYRVISLDSHAIAGAIMFSVGDAPAGDVRLEAEDLATVLSLAATRALFLAALLIATGAILALWLVADFAGDVVCRGRRTVLLAGLAALLLGALLLGVAGCNFAGVPLTGLAEAATWRLALSTALAQSLAVAGAGLTLMLAALPRLEHGSNRLVAVAGSLIALGSLALTGHAATAAPQWLMRWAVPLHALCAAFWLGALPLLAAAVRTEPPERAHRYAVRFSAYALVAVTTMLALGLALAVVQVEQLALMWQTAYGIVLQCKLAAIALLLAVAAYNKWHATPLLAAGSPGARAIFRRAIYAEYLLFAGIIAFTAMLGEIEPPRAQVERDARALTGGADFTESRTQAGYRITLSVAPARAGHNALAIDMTDADGRTVTPREVALELSLPAAGIEPLRRQAQHHASGRFIHHGNDLAWAGRWRIEVHALIDDFTKPIVAFDVPIR
jgi:copper transport protein